MPTAFLGSEDATESLLFRFSFWRSKPFYLPIVVQRKLARKASFHSLMGLAESAKPYCKFSEYCANLDNLSYQIAHHEVGESCSETEYNLPLWKNTARFSKVPLCFNLWHCGGQEELPNTGCLWTKDGKVETAQLKQPGELLWACNVNCKHATFDSPKQNFEAYIFKWTLPMESDIMRLDISLLLFKMSLMSSDAAF